MPSEKLMGPPNMHHELTDEDSGLITCVDTRNGHQRSGNTVASIDDVQLSASNVELRKARFKSGCSL